MMVKQYMDEVPYGVFADRRPPTSKQEGDRIEIARTNPLRYPPFYVYAVEVTPDGTGSQASGYVHPIFERAGEVWAAMDKCR
jgi:hypothetical protein